MEAIERWMGFTPDWWRKPNQAEARRLKAYLSEKYFFEQLKVFSSKLTTEREEDANQPLSTSACEHT